MRERVQRFLERTGMNSTGVNIRQGAAAFAQAMGRGMAGEASSLLMLPTWLHAEGDLPAHRSVTVIDAGGTNLRMAEVVFSAGDIRVDFIRRSRMPGTQFPIGREEFFDAVADYLAALDRLSDPVGFCFSFPAEILPTLEGRILSLDKEIQIVGAAGACIGEGMNRALAQRDIPFRRFILLNDAAAVLLGGMAQGRNTAYSGQISYILGTGTNIGYLEQCEHIRKVPKIAALPGQMVVNVESGGYSGIIQGEADRILDAASTAPGQMKLEKMLSGRYLGAVITQTVRLAVRDGLFSTAFARRMLCCPDFTMEQVDRFLVQPRGAHPLAALCETAADMEVLRQLAENAIDRAARLSAMTLAAVMEYTDSGRDHAHPVCITVEGTTFDKTPLLRTRLETLMDKTVGRQMHRYGIFQQIENATLVGTAAAVWLNG